MNQRKFFIALAVCAFVMGGCGQQSAERQNGEDSVGMEQAEPLQMAIESYLVDSIGGRYAWGEVCIPYSGFIVVEGEGLDTVRVWGDWWVDNFDLVDDTLKCVSGGSHPGMFVLVKEADGYRVDVFDQVEDGSRCQPSAERIFGKHYEDFHAVNSNEGIRDSVRLEVVSEYVREHGLKVTCLQDYGWPAVELWK